MQQFRSERECDSIFSYIFESLTQPAFLPSTSRVPTTLSHSFVVSMSMQRSSSLSELRRGAFSSRKLSTLLSPPKLSALHRIILSLTAICGVTIVTSFLSGALTVALPSIAKSINLSQELLSWPLSMFSLVSGALLLISGGMADAFGRRLVFLLGITLWAVLSFVTAFVKTVPASLVAVLGLDSLLPCLSLQVLASSAAQSGRQDQESGVRSHRWLPSYRLHFRPRSRWSTCQRMAHHLLDPRRLAIFFGVCAFSHYPTKEKSSSVRQTTRPRRPSSISPTTQLRLLWKAATPPQPFLRTSIRATPRANQLAQMRTISYSCSLRDQLKRHFASRRSTGLAHSCQQAVWSC